MSVERKKNSTGSIKFLGGMSRRSSRELKGQACILPQASKSMKNHGKLKILMLRQTIEVHEGAIWALEFSLDGDYLATAGKSRVVYIWKLTRNREALLEENPVQELSAHSKDVVDLAWSSRRFLFSASLDQTVRMWAPERSDCLRIFRHSSAVTSISCFEGSLLTGSADRKVRLWDIELGRVISWTRTNKAVTCVAISPAAVDASCCAAVGLAQGEVVFFRMQTMEYVAEIHCKNRYGQFNQGTKVTGLCYMKGGEQLLVTTNDSRLRIFCTTTFVQLSKYKGHVNESMLIKATAVNDDSIISGSENGFVYLWRVETNTVRATVDAYERFAATGSTPPVVTAACTAPEHVITAIYGGSASPLRLILCAGLDGLLKVIEAQVMIN